jgi:poly-gamma-glutamate synthesis protein (capsule biosynthesis protein)
VTPLNMGNESDSTACLLAVGDVALDTGPEGRPLAVLDLFRGHADLMVANLETVLSRRTAGAVEKAVLLRADPGRARWLAAAGVSVVCVANNHTLDFGAAGFTDTLAALEEAGVTAAGRAGEDGAARPVVVPAGALRLGFLAYTEAAPRGAATPIAGFAAAAAAADVRALRNACDAVVVHIHGGVENCRYPSPGQVAASRALLDAGATLVLGHHPHVVQGVERRGDGLIAYSLGNFQFRPVREAQRDTVALEVTLSRHRVLRHRIHPLRIDPGGVPAAADAAGEERVASLVARLSEQVASERLSRGEWHARMARPYLRDNLAAWSGRIRRYGIRHAWQAARWAVSPFVLRCYWGWLRAALRPREQDLS